MVEVETDEDILRFAISREEQAHQFYRILAGYAETASVRKIFEELAKEELGHKAKLELEIMKIGKVVTDSERIEDLQQSDFIISGLDLDMNYKKDLLKLGIEKEDEAIMIYADLASKVRRQSFKEIFLALIQEEVKHKLRFETEHENLLREL